MTARVCVCVLCLLKNLFYLCLMITNEVIMIWNASKRIYYFVTILLRKVVGEIVFFFLHCSHAELSAIELSKAQNFDGIMNVDVSLSLPARSGDFHSGTYIFFTY